MTKSRDKKTNLLSYIRDGKKLDFKQKLTLVGSLSAPAIMAQLTSVVMQYIDASMVGRLGAVPSASIGLVSTTTWLFGSICMSATVGYSVQVAQHIGAGRYDSAKSVVRQSLLIITLLSVILTVAGLLICKPLPRWLGGDKELWIDASRYFMVYACAIPIMGINYLAGSMLQCSGNMKVPSLLNILMCVLDVLFNALFIYGLKLGVLGAALGTLVAEIIVASMMFRFLIKSKELHISFKESFRPTMECQIKALKIATPVAFEHIVVCGAMIVTTRIVAPLGTIALAANSFAVTAESLCYMPGYGIGDAATTLVGQSIGAGRHDLVRHFARMTVVVGIAVMTCIGIIMYFAAPAMISILTPDIEVQKLGVAMLRIEAFAEPMYGASIVASGALRGAGDTFIPSILNFVSLWLVRLPLAIFLAGECGLAGVWIAMCAELIFRGIIFLIRLYRERWIKC